VPSNFEPGYIIFECSRCGYILRLIAWGDPDKRLTTKYAGLKATSEIVEVMPRCPRCGAPLRPRPRQILILTRREVDVNDYKKRWLGEEA